MSETISEKTVRHAGLLARYQRAAARADTLNKLRSEAVEERDEVMGEIAKVYDEIVALRDAHSDSQDC